MCGLPAGFRCTFASKLLPGRFVRDLHELQELLAVQKSSCGIAKFVGGHYDIQIIVHGFTKSSAEFVHCIIEILVSELARTFHDCALLEY